MSAFFSFLLGLGYRWAYLLVLISIMIALWIIPIFPDGSSISDNVNNLQIYLIYWENMTELKIFNYATIGRIYDFTFLAVSIAWLLHFLKPHGGSSHS